MQLERPMQRLSYKALCVLVVSATWPTVWAQQPTRTVERKVVARIGGQEIFEDELIAPMQAQLRPLREQEFQLEAQALDRLLQDKVLETEAARLGLTKEQLLRQVDSGVSEPTDGEIAAFYLAQRDRLNQPLASGAKCAEAG
jgi:hypothetical protein